MKSPEWRWQRRRANLRHFEIFRHGPIIIYTRLPAGGTYYPICMFPASSECLIGIFDAFSAFCLRVSVIFPICSVYPQQKRAYSALHPQAWTYIYRSMPGGSYRVQSPGFPKIVYSHQCYRIFGLSVCYTVIILMTVGNRRFPEITGKDNLTVFSYSRRVKSPEWRRQLRRANLPQF